jgi:hypothetical protein
MEQRLMVPLKVPLKARLKLLLPHPHKQRPRLLNRRLCPRLLQLGLLRPPPWIPTYSSR